jgi:membrane protein YdbS with pleckstrin-like domain
VIPVTVVAAMAVHDGTASKEVSMSSIDQQLVQGEFVHYRARLHWIVLVGPFVVSAVCGIVGLLLVAVAVIFWMDNEAIQSAFLTGIVAVQVAGWIILLGLLHRALAEIAITNRRILKSGGLIRRRTVQLSLPNIKSVDTRQSPMGHMLGYGSIIVVASGKTNRPFRYVPGPLDFKHRVEEEVAKLKTVSRRAAA